jgi:uncharacterized protein
MKLFKKLAGFILPKEVDFFGNLCNQSAVTQHIVTTLRDIYIEKTKTTEHLDKAIEDANELRIKNLEELNNVLITPVDKEAISRVYLSLDWITLSIQHLNVEIGAYNVSSLNVYEKIFNLLKNQMEQLSSCFSLLKKKKYSEVMDGMNDIIRLDDELIQEYAVQLAALFKNDSIKFILGHKEILFQLKEVSKRIHVCANNVEDIVFKMH